MEQDSEPTETNYDGYEVISESEAAYFNSYEDVEIHRLMLRDGPRTEAYQKAILGNKAFFQGKTVMDVGCGTGILSLFCAQAGARKVYAVEASQMADVARRVVEKNGFSDVIEVLHGRAEEVELPEGVQVDVIVSEWMGFYLLHESMLEAVVAARDKHLKPNGVMMPSRATLYAAACRLPDFYTERVHFWNDVYGLDLSPVGDHVLKSQGSRPEVTLVKADDILSKALRVVDLDLAWIGVEDIQELKSRHFTDVTSLDTTDYQGVCLWFDCDFQVDGGSEVVRLTTAPDAPATHWKQTVIVLPTPGTVEEGDVIGWDLKLVQSSINRRQYVIELELLDPETDEHPVPCSCGSARCAIIAAYLAKEDEMLLADSGEQVIDIS